MYNMYSGDPLMRGLTSSSDTFMWSILSCKHLTYPSDERINTSYLGTLLLCVESWPLIICFTIGMYI